MCVWVVAGNHAPLLGARPTGQSRLRSGQIRIGPHGSRQARPDALVAPVGPSDRPSSLPVRSPPRPSAPSRTALRALRGPRICRNRRLEKSDAETLDIGQRGPSARGDAETGKLTASLEAIAGAPDVQSISTLPGSLPRGPRCRMPPTVYRTNDESGFIL